MCTKDPDKKKEKTLNQILQLSLYSLRFAKDINACNYSTSANSKSKLLFALRTAKRALEYN